LHVVHDEPDVHDNDDENGGDDSDADRCCDGNDDNCDACNSGDLGGFYEPVHLGRQMT
jgi:hypothetical protein